jgi:Conserved hypothetical protein (DUF2461)
VLVRSNENFQRIAGYSPHIEHGASYANVGIFRTGSCSLSKIRTRISTEFGLWKTVTEIPEVKAYFPDGFIALSVLKNGPKDFRKNNPASAYLKLEFTATDLQQKICSNRCVNP